MLPSETFSLVSPSNPLKVSQDCWLLDDDVMLYTHTTHKGFIVLSDTKLCVQLIHNHVM